MTSDHDKGRAKNGIIIAVPNSVKNQVEDISSDFYRVQVLRIQFKIPSCVLVNSYFPCDPQAPRREEPELLETLNSIKSVLKNTEFTSVIWAEDINADFVRHTNHTEAVQEVLDKLNLFTLWDKHEVDFTCTHEINKVTHVSKLDHFFLSENIKNNVEDTGVMHHPDNKSDHCPIYSVFKTLEITQEAKISFYAKP